MIINIKPVDALFFRDSKPFGRGSEHFAKSIFPPFPQTLYGALRTKVLEELNCDYEEFKKGNLVFKNQELISKIGYEKIKNEIGTKDESGEFELKGPFLLKNDEEIYLKLPIDVKIIDNENSKQIKIMHPFNWNNYGIETDFTSLNNYPYIITDKPVKDVDGYVSFKRFVDSYLLGEEIKIEDIKKAKDIFDYEMRVGIGIDSEKNKNKEGLLYTIGLVKLNKGWSLCANVENLSALPESGLIRFGGANRVCEYNTLSIDLFKYYFDKMDEIKKIIKESQSFKMIFLTPALFNNGWISNRFNENFELQINNIKIRLISAAIKRGENISGWDLAKNKAKAMRRLIPAGSVYYFKLIEGNIDELYKELSFVNFTDQYPNHGFGTILIGGNKYV